MISHFSSLLYRDENLILWPSPPTGPKFRTQPAFRSIHFHKQGDREPFQSPLLLSSNYLRQVKGFHLFCRLCPYTYVWAGSIKQLVFFFFKCKIYICNTLTSSIQYTRLSMSCNNVNYFQDHCRMIDFLHVAFIKSET